MAIRANTTKSMSKASVVLGEKCEATKANMDSLLAAAGLDPKKIKRIETYIPLIPGEDDDVVFVGYQGQRFYFRRGETVSIPEPCLQILKDCGVI